MQITIIAVYLLLTLIIGFLFRRRAAESPAAYFLAGRKLSPLLLFFTMAASNFSAFTIFGLSGAGYRIGYAFYPVMAFGTGFMALAFWLIGSKILKLSKERGYLAPGDFIGDRYCSRGLQRLFSAVMLLFTLPYVAIQIIAAGRSLESLTGLPFLYGAVGVTLFVALYVGLGGLRSIAWTDLLQGGMMILFSLLALIIISRRAGGFIAIHRRIAEISPEHLSRPGADGSLTPGVWLSFMILWFFADPMFPHLFQRYMAAESERALKTTVVLYPLITGFLFFLTVSIGVIGRVLLPGLPAGESDTVFPLLLNRFAHPALAALLVTGSLAALMSTMDSQLLTGTSIIRQEFFTAGEGRVARHRLSVWIIALLALLIAVRPPETILEFINKTTFNGLAVLAPTVIGGLYWKRGNAFGSFASILSGEAMVLLFYFEVISVAGVLPIIPIMLVAGAAYILGSLFFSHTSGTTELVFRPKRKALFSTPLFLGLFVLGNDFWNWENTPRLYAGLPGWVWGFMGLCVLTSCAFKICLLANEHDIMKNPQKPLSNVKPN